LTVTRRECRTAGVQSKPKSSCGHCRTWKRCQLRPVSRPGKPHHKAGQGAQHWEDRRSQSRRQHAGYAHVGQVTPCKRVCGTIEQERKQMTAHTADASFPSSTPDWKALDWRTIWQEVRRLQMRIAKAIQAGKHRKAQALQWLLTHSIAAKLWAVRRVTTNRGAKTPGVDNVLWRTSEQKVQAAFNLKRHGYKPQPLRRHYIPKPNGKLRPLSIPTVSSYCT
jgi:N-terminal domain of reverse transcriptase